MASIAVVGGGVAGLTCAWRLRRAGHDVEVLEREAAPGGRARCERRGKYRLTSGPVEVQRGDRNVLSVMRALGLEAPAPGGRSGRGSGGRAVLRAGHLHAPTRFGFLRSADLPAGARARLAAGLTFALLRHRRRLDPLRPELAADLDGESAAAASTRIAGTEAGSAALAPLLRLAWDAEPDQLSWPAALLAMCRPASEGEALAFDADAFATALAGAVRVRTGCEVTSVETETGGARVRCRWRGRERSVLADAVVVAVPGCGVPFLCPKLTPAERGFFETLATGSAVMVHLLLERRPPGSQWCEIALPASEGLDLARVCIAPHGSGAAPAGAGLVSATLAAAALERMGDASDAALADLALESLAATPLGALTPTEFSVRRLQADEPSFAPGSLRQLARFLARLERTPRLAFAGGYLVGRSVEARVTSGMRAATEVVRAL